MRSGGFRRLNTIEAWKKEPDIAAIRDLHDLALDTPKDVACELPDGVR